MAGGAQLENGEPTESFAFGLSADELVNITDALAVTVVSETQNRSVKTVLREISRQVGPKIALDASARGKIKASAKVPEEYLGMSAGTAMAAVLRPLGLVLVPVSTGTETRLIVKDVRQAKENWPVGWPREGDPGKLVPKWFDSLEVEINKVPLSEALGVLQQRLDIPFLMDQNGMARKEIEPDQTPVSFPARKSFYGKIIRSVLSQSGLKGEIRADEAGNPFLWIYPARL